MLDYPTQLDFKRKVVDKAYTFFSGLPTTSVPHALPTIASPKTYGYRTKITPHFDEPRKVKGDDGSVTVHPDWDLRIGFDEKGRRRVMDIEVSIFMLSLCARIFNECRVWKECPIATPILNQSLPSVRAETMESVV